MIYSKLDVYVLGLDLVSKIYVLTGSFPKEELFGLSSQIRRASTSIILNIAEGSSRKTSKEYAHFLRIALGSATEINAICDVIITINLCTKDDLKEIIFICLRVRKMLQSIIHKLENKPKP